MITINNSIVAATTMLMRSRVHAVLVQTDSQPQHSGERERAHDIVTCPGTIKDL